VSTPEPIQMDEGQQGYSGNNGNPAGNPAWNEFLSVVPQELHPKVTPILESWDKGVNDRFAKVHSEYKPWDNVIKSGYDPEATQFALGVLQALNDDPEQVYKALGEHYGFTGQGQADQKEDVNGEPDPYEPRFKELKEQNETLASYLMQKHEQEQIALAEAQLDKELSEMKGKYGDFDEDYVLALLANDDEISTEDAVKAFITKRDQIISSHRPKPLIMGSGGSLPGQGVDPRKLDDKGTKSLIVQMLQAHQEANR